MSAPKIWNPYTQADEYEKVFGESGIEFLYQEIGGRIFRKLLTTSSWFSKVYGAYQSTKFSTGQIESFVKNYSIDMNEYEEKNWGSFNDFFTRKFKPNLRKFSTHKDILPAPCEARYLFYSGIDRSTRVNVKGALLDPFQLLNGEPECERFIGGDLAIARLCPLDYHRFHFFDNCKFKSYRKIHGNFESVNPLAVNSTPNVFIKNERSISILNTENFGMCAMVEVGALCVGKIIQSWTDQSKPYTRGDEKGYFLFGASTVIIIFEANKIKWENSFKSKSDWQQEVFVRLGDKIGERVKQ